MQYYLSGKPECQSVLLGKYPCDHTTSCGPATDGEAQLEAALHTFLSGACSHHPQTQCTAYQVPVHTLLQHGGHSITNYST